MPQSTFNFKFEKKIFLRARKGRLQLRKQNIVKISIIYILQGVPKISDFQNAAEAQKS